MISIRLGNIIPLRFITAAIFIILLFLITLSFKNPVRVEQFSFYAGNVGIGESAPLDTTAPSVSITNPINGSSVSGLVNVTAEASDSGGIAQVEFYADSSLIGTSSSAPYSSFWNTTVYPHNSSHLIHARAFDLASNVASSSAVFVTVLDVTAPSVNITNPANSAIVPRRTTVTIAANSQDVSGIQKVEFRVDNVLKCTDTLAPYSCNWKVPPQKNRTYTIQVKSSDNAVNTATHTISVTSSN